MLQCYVTYILQAQNLRVKKNAKEANHELKEVSSNLGLQGA